jgi:NAD(P)-dependent dehydrogenase (short-subunit alcohol dehydrogenase family)
MSHPQRVFITGASAGFGFDTSRALASKGHTIYATMRGVSNKNADKAQALTNWAKENGHALHVLEVDVTNDASVGKAVAAAVEEGGIDVLINNAGIGTWGVDEGYTIEQAQKVFDINLFGVMRVNRAMVSGARTRGRATLAPSSGRLPVDEARTYA